MDEFGVLVESIGFRAQGKSAPMAKLKPKPKSQFTTRNTSSFQDSHTLPVDELDGVFRSNVNISKQSQNTFVDDDIFGGPVSSSNQFGGVDLDSVFGSSNNVSNLNSRNSVGSNAYEDWLGTNSKQAFPVDDLLGTNSKQTYPADDLLGVFGRNSPVKQDKKVPEFDDLIPGFGGASPSKAEINSNANISWESSGRPSRSSSPVIDDPFLVFESTAHQSNASAHSSFDVFDDFIMGGAKSGSKVDTQRNTAKKPTSGRSSNGFVDDIFGGHQNNNAARPSSMGQNSLFGEFFDEAKEPEVKQTSSWSSSSTKKASSAANVGNDFSSLFGDVTTSSGEFQEIDGEPEERRRARLNRHMRTNARMAEALAEKNQRDIQSQREHEEKHRLAETLDNDIKRWATGKEGNLRALLSSLQQVLWPDCGWRPVSLTDMITSDSVKKAYKKATLYVHPDKVQQKGASLQQKYIAEKVFDLLKEAWNKFSAEELR